MGHGKAPASIKDVAAYVLARKGPRTAMQLEKLVYYGQAWSMVWEGRPLFEDAIEAWVQGPVSPALFDLHRGRYLVVSLPEGNPDALDAFAQETLDAVLDQYGNCSGDELGELTHREAPWQDTPRNHVISLNVMRDCYARCGLDAARATGSLSERFMARHLCSQITEDHWHPETDWADPVGCEIL